MTIPAPEEQSLPTIRFAVSVVSGPYPPAKVCLTEQLDGLIKFSVSGDGPFTPDLAKTAVEVAESIAKNMSSGERLFLVSKALRTRFEAEGYLVQELPAADFQFTAAFDLETGRVIGRQKALHDVTPLDLEIADRVSEAVREAFQGGPRKLAVEINRLVGIDDHVGAAVAVSEGRSSLGFFGVLHIELFEALQRINVLLLPLELEKEIRMCRMAVAAHVKRFDDAEADAQIILDKGFFEDFADSVKFTNVVAFACFKRGEVETAIGMWKDLLNSASPLYAADRGWIWRNLANALPSDSSEAVRAARLSVDAFLEAGEKREAATSMLLLSRLLEYEGPIAAVNQLRDMLDLIDANGLIEDALRSSIYHSLATQYLKLRSVEPGLKAALEAVSLLRGVAGAEKDLVCSLNLAAILAEKCEEFILSEELSAEAVAIEDKGSAGKFALARRVAKLFDEFNASEAEEIRMLVEKSEDLELISLCEVAIAVSDPDFSATQRLRKLESIVVKLERAKSSPGARHPVMLAIVKVLKEEGRLDRAEIWLRRILSEQPLNLDARDSLLQILWESEAWGDAAIFTKQQITLHGELPGLLFAHGKSQLEAGEFNGALATFMLALSKVDADNPMRTTILEWREKALVLGASPPLISQTIDRAKPILKEEVLEALGEFSKFISCDKRMVFWYRPSPKDDYKWVPSPEKRAQDLFHTFLKARFLERISIFEELGTGAGRLDVYLKLDGGLAVIVELKMCGFGYSSTYAASGEKQIEHYMDNRSSNIGYLLVFDARLTSNEMTLLSVAPPSSKTIFEVFVDVRPRVAGDRGKV